MQLKDVKRGETFDHCGHNWIVLEHDETGHTLALSEDIIGKMPFDEDNCNNWAKSSLRKYLNGDFVKELCGDTENDDLGFCPYHLDLTADDGLKDYGITTDFIFLLTCDMYRKNRDVIQPIDEWWWTATALSACASNACNSRDVDADGTLNSHGAYCGGSGVRPACYLKSDLLLSGENETETESEAVKMFKKFSPTVQNAALNFMKLLASEGGNYEP